MRLLHTTTGQFRDFNDPRLVKYAILSHVWVDPKVEMTYQRVRDIQEDNSQSGSVIASFPAKLRNFLQLAAQDDYEYAWADVCCIDKTSSAEVSEAINSMYDWYRNADTCYVFLHDVPTSTPAQLSEALGRPFENSIWHKRGWTLQELLAPRRVVFFSAQWHLLGTKHSLAAFIRDITGIDCDALTLRKPLDKFSVACRMFWASSRSTTREEDEAYSLLGIFEVHMPTNYGEGRYAFIRLQEEILRHIPDQSIFAWGLFVPSTLRSFSLSSYIPTSTDNLSLWEPLEESFNQSKFLFASSPKQFRYSSTIVSIRWSDFKELLGIAKTHGKRPTYTMTHYGMRTRLHLVGARTENPFTNAPTCIALLACKNSANDELMSLQLRTPPKHSQADYSVGAIMGELRDITEWAASDISALSNHYFRMASLSCEDVEAVSSVLQNQQVYIPYWPPQASYNVQRDIHLHAALRSVSSDEAFDLQLSAMSCKLFKSWGYDLIYERDRGSFSVRMVAHASASKPISIYVRRCKCQYGEKQGYLSVDVLPGDSPSPSRDPAPHLQDHDSHVGSWTFRDGAASKDFYLRFPDKLRVVVRLTLSRRAESSSLHILAVDMWTPVEEDLQRERMRHKSKIQGLSRSPAVTAPGTPRSPYAPLSPISRGPSLNKGAQQRPWGGMHLSIPGPSFGPRIHPTAGLQRQDALEQPTRLVVPGAHASTSASSASDASEVSGAELRVLDRTLIPQHAPLQSGSSGASGAQLFGLPSLPDIPPPPPPPPPPLPPIPFQPATVPHTHALSQQDVGSGHTPSVVKWDPEGAPTPQKRRLSGEESVTPDTLPAGIRSSPRLKEKRLRDAREDVLRSQETAVAGPSGSSVQLSGLAQQTPSGQTPGVSTPARGMGGGRGTRGVGRGGGQRPRAGPSNAVEPGASSSDAASKQPERPTKRRRK